MCKKTITLIALLVAICCSSSDPSEQGGCPSGMEGACSNFIPGEDKFYIERVPIEFAIAEEAPVIFDRHTNWFCVTIKLLPEDGGDKYAVLAKRVDGYNNDRRTVNDGARHDEKTEETPYKSDHAAYFIGVRHSDEDEICRKLGGVYAKYSDLHDYTDGRFSPPKIYVPEDENDPDRDELETHVKEWNKAQAHLPSEGSPSNGCSTEEECEGFHVSYVKIPDDLQQRFTDRLMNNWELFYESDAVGIAGTTGANFIAGNSGYRFPNFGQNKLDTIFGPEGEDKRNFEDALTNVVFARKDIKEKFGHAIQVDFQHRLWRYGPDFPSSGGIWHKDTCPFGIGGAVPKDSWQLTSVFVFYADNMDRATSGTRIKDRFDETHDMPCIPGTANVIRSGENDPYSPWHSGPLLKKIDPEKPAFRVMLQSKMVLSRADHEPPVNGEQWGGLGGSALPDVEPDEEKEALKAWFKKWNQWLSWGASESNAVGSEAYPENAQRAWSRCEELAIFFGFQPGFLPQFSKPPEDEKSCG